MPDLKKYIIAIDQSTSASKVMLFSHEATLLHRISIPHKQFYPQPGFVEQNAEEIYNNVITGLDQLVSKTEISESEISAIAITNQRETALVWDRTTGIPIAKAVVWQCQRGKDFCQELKEKALGQKIQEKTGLIIDPYFSASKIRWLIKNVPGAEAKAQRGELLLGTMDSWLLWKLTMGNVHATDYSNACRTMLFNIHTLQWDPELIELFGLHESMFPEVKYSDEIFGYTDPKVVFESRLPISGLIGDSHGAFFGQNCFKPGLAKATYGTGSSVMMHIGTAPLDPPGGLVTSIGFGRHKEINYVFEGNIHCTGDTLNWLKEELELINDVSEVEALATSVDSNRGVYLVPAFVGLGAPYWDNDARAALVGMSRDSSKAHVVRAALESIVYQVKDLIDLMESDKHIQLSELRVDGGPTRNDFLMQFQADMLQGRVERNSIEEISALGAAFLAGLATGFWSSLEEIEGLRESEMAFKPALPEDKTTTLYKGWKLAVARSRLKDS